jgi:fructose-1,6-bisphosphatase II
VSSDEVFLAATGITNGELVKGIRYTPYGAVSESIVMRGKSKTVRVITTEHHIND